MKNPGKAVLFATGPASEAEREAAVLRETAGAVLVIPPEARFPLLRAWAFLGFAPAEIVCLQFPGHGWLKLQALLLRGRAVFAGPHGRTRLSLFAFLGTSLRQAFARGPDTLLVAASAPDTLARLENQVRSRWPDSPVVVLPYWRALAGRRRFRRMVVPWTDEGHSFQKLTACLLPCGLIEIYNEQGDSFPARDLRMCLRHLAWRAHAKYRLVRAAKPWLGPLRRWLKKASDQRMRDELAHYKDVETVHDLPEIFHFWSNKYVRPKLEEVLGVSGMDEFYIRFIRQHASENGGPGPVEIASLGAGNCDLEVRLGTLLRSQGLTGFRFLCLDINPDMLARGRVLAAKAGIADHYQFLQTSVTQWRPERSLAVVIAHQSLHHMVELEDLFANVKAAIGQTGYFLTNDMIGRNGHMRWPEALAVVHEIWRQMPARYKHNHQLHRFEELYENWDCSQVGFEGIRAQDILPLLVQEFHFEAFVAYGCLPEIFVDRGFGPNFDPNNPEDLAFVDEIGARNDRLIDEGRIKPTQMVAAMRARPVPNPRWFRHWSPQFCLRPTA